MNSNAASAPKAEATPRMVSSIRRFRACRVSARWVRKVPMREASSGMML